MATIDALMHANLLGVFGERDAARRRTTIAETYTPDVVFSDPGGTETGHDAIDAKAQTLLDRSPGFVFAPAGAVHVVRDLGHLAWSFGPEGQSPVVRGVDVALVRDGLIASLYTFLLED